MWNSCSASDVKLGNYMQAATFDADIEDVAKRFGVELTNASEDTGPINIIHLSNSSGQFALLISHECGDPFSIEIRLNARAGSTDWVMSQEELKGALAAVGVTLLQCIWICPLVASSAHDPGPERNL